MWKHAHLKQHIVVDWVTDLAHRTLVYIAGVGGRETKKRRQGKGLKCGKKWEEDKEGQRTMEAQGVS